MINEVLGLQNGGYLLLSSLEPNSYFIGFDNTFVTPNSPLVVEFGAYITKENGYKCITKYDKSDYDVLPLYKNGLYKVNDNVVQCSRVGNYSLAVYDLLADIQTPLIYSFYAYQSPQIINKEMCLQIINAELPTIYKPSNELNNADNNGIAQVMADVYKEVYTLFYGIITSLGVENEYNPNWESVYIGVNKFLNNAAYPAQFLKTLMQVATKTGVSFKDIATFASRISYQFIGEPVPVRVFYQELTNSYRVDIYLPDDTFGDKVWFLGYSTLGNNTYLFDKIGNAYIYILCKLITRLMPVTVKYNIRLLPYQEFLNNFDTVTVTGNDYIDHSINYDAYVVINNNNLFNTKGYLLNE